MLYRMAFNERDTTKVMAGQSKLKLEKKNGYYWVMVFHPEKWDIREGIENTCCCLQWSYSLHAFVRDAIRSWILLHLQTELNVVKLGYNSLNVVDMWGWHRVVARNKTKNSVYFKTSTVTNYEAWFCYVGLLKIQTIQGYVLCSY